MAVQDGQNLFHNLKNRMNLMTKMEMNGSAGCLNDEKQEKSYRDSAEFRAPRVR